MATPRSGKQNCLKPVNTALKNLIDGATKTKKTQISRLFSKLLGLLCYRKSPYRADNSVNSFAGLTPRPFILFPA